MDTETQPTGGGNAPRKRTRRGRKRKPRTCCREGCERVIGFSDDRPACSFLCNVVVQELERSQRICEATRDTDHWLAVVGLNDALTDYYASDSRVYHAACSDGGMTDQEWRRIKLDG